MSKRGLCVACVTEYTGWLINMTHLSYKTENCIFSKLFILWEKNDNNSKKKINKKQNKNKKQTKTKILKLWPIVTHMVWMLWWFVNFWQLMSFD